MTLPPKAVAELLRESPGVATLVDERIFPGAIPQEVWDSASEKPCIVYSLNSTRPDRTTCGVSGLSRTDYVIEGVARTYDDAAAIGEAVAGAIIYWTGSVEGFDIDTVILVSQSDAVDGEQGIYRRVGIYTFWSGESE